MKRLLQSYVFSGKFGRQMRFITGPRQVGKTTIARKFLDSQHCSSLYYNFDYRDVRKRLRSEPYFYINDAGSGTGRWVCFDEIHKLPKWKNVLKECFDRSESEFNFIITGSARLDHFRKAGDSLAGRYFLFRLFPLTLREVCGVAERPIVPDARAFIEARLEEKSRKAGAVKELLAMSGFPEPFLKADPIFLKNWRDQYIDRVIREDLRDLSRIVDVEHMATIVELLPERIGSPLSLNSLREDLEVSHNAVKNYVRCLELGYLIFALSPYSNRIARAVKKERKYYFFDYTRIADPSIRFENFLALELAAFVDGLKYASPDEWNLNFFKTKDGRESDFLILKNRRPWLLLEAKLTETDIARHHYLHAAALGNIPIVQVVQAPGIAKRVSDMSYVVSAERFL